jgi:hypothetical protein
VPVRAGIAKRVSVHELRTFNNLSRQVAGVIVPRNNGARDGG